jgi:fructose/tagatose bisphosphate aldolase
MVLHGGTGLAPEQFEDCIERGCAKVNISTALKIAFVDAHREYLDANPAKKDPPSLFAHVRDAVTAMADAHIRLFGSVGKAATGARAPTA